MDRANGLKSGDPLEELIHDDRLLDWLSLNQWAMWHWVNRGNYQTKVPSSGFCRPAKPNDPATWCSFLEARKRMRIESASGVYFAFSESDPFCGVDLDDCRDPATGATEKWAANAIKFFNSYTEVSPSKTGYKIFGIGKLSGRGFRREIEAGKIELYDRCRFFAVTGWRINSRPMVYIQDQVSKVERWAKPKRVAPPPPGRATTDVNARALALAKTMYPAVSGENGHTRFYKAAIALTRGLGLTADEAEPALRVYNSRCLPPFNEFDFQRKLRDAERSSVSWGYLLA